MVLASTETLQRTRAIIGDEVIFANTSFAD